MRAYGGEVFEWPAHRERLEDTCKTMGMPGAVPDDLALRIADTLDANDFSDARVHVSITRGTGIRPITPTANPDPTVVVMVWDLPNGGTDGQPVWNEPAVVQTTKIRRSPDTANPVPRRTHSNLNAVLARLELRRAENEHYHPDEALLRDLDGNIASGAASDIFFIDGGILKTPPATGDTGTSSVARRVVLELSRKEGLPVEIGRYGLDAIRGADEGFLANTVWEIRPIGTVDGMEIGAGPMTRLLSRLYNQRVETTCYYKREHG